MQFGRETANVSRTDYVHDYPDISVNLSGSPDILLLPLQLYDLVKWQCVIILMQGLAGKNIDSFVAHFLCVSKE